MSSQNIDKVVKLACKPKNAPPKPKYVDVLVAATYSEDGSLGTACTALAMRLREQNGVVVFKALLTLHQMIRSGSTDQLLDHLVKSQSLRLQHLGDQNFEGYLPPTSMAAYGEYIDVRIRTFKDLKHDLVRVQTESNRRSDGLGAGSKARRLRHLAVDKGLLREVKAVQRILDALIRCRFYDDDLKDENTILAFRMLIKDLLVLFQAGNEGVCNILEHYFEMSKSDATEAFDIYKSFIKQTDKIVDYLGIARKLQNVVNVPVPNLKHAPTGLVKALEEYLHDPNFENNRREYRKSLGVVEGRGSDRTPSPAPPASTQSQAPKAAAPASTLTSAPTQTSSSAAAPPPGSSQKIQDFFDSIQADSQPTMFGGPPQQMNYHQMQQPAFNPFRQSMMMPQQTGFMPQQMTGFPGGMQQQAFLQPQQTGAMAFGNQQPMFQQSQQQSQPFQPTPQQPFMQPTQTGFQPNQTGMQPQQTGFLQPQATGPNPFRQSMMLNTNNMGGAFSQPSSPFGQSSSPSLPSQIQRPGSTPAQPLVSQPTGSKNPFAPAPGQAQKAATVSSRGPTMNELAMGFGRDQGQGQQAQTQAQSPWATMNGKTSTGSGMADVASSFVFNDSNKGNNNPNDDFMAQFGSLSVNTSSTGPSSSTNNSQSSPFNQFSPTSAFGGSGAPNQPTSSTEFLQPQQTGYGGSNVKPFKPTSSFGSQLLDGLAPVASPSTSPGVAASPQAPSGGIQSQMTGFPGMGQQSNGAGAGGMGQFGAFGSNNTGGNGGMMGQNTGMANPFRQSTMPTGGGGMGNSPFGQPPSMAFGANSPFAGQNKPSQPGQQQGQGQFGQGFGGQQGGSLI